MWHLACMESLWLDNITQDLLSSGTLEGYIKELLVTGLTSNPSIFEQALKGSEAYDQAIRDGKRTGRTGEALFFDLAIDDLRRTADLSRPVCEPLTSVKPPGRATGARRYELQRRPGETARRKAMIPSVRLHLQWMEGSRRMASPSLPAYGVDSGTRYS